MKTNLSLVQEIKLSYSPAKFSYEAKKIQCSEDALEVLLPFYNHDTIACQEEFLLLLLNKSNMPLGLIPISKGGVSCTVVDVKLVMSIALKFLASSIILSHNHPSGSLEPSEDDKKLTRKIKEACEVMDIKLLDHIIVTPDHRHRSFADKGEL
jgi:DNA repair protein RadC